MYPRCGPILTRHRPLIRSGDGSSHQVAEFIPGLKYDSTNGYPLLDSLVYNFTFSGNNALPGGYAAYSSGSVTADVHQLSYDGQNRVTKDSSLSGSGFVTYYSYPNSLVIARVLFDGTAANNQIDTFSLSNGNVGGYKVYMPNDAGTSDSLQGNLTYGYSGYANPLISFGNHYYHRAAVGYPEYKRVWRHRGMYIPQYAEQHLRGCRRASCRPYVHVYRLCGQTGEGI